MKLVGNPWQCDCSVAELWEWALNWRGDLGLLVGSTITPEDTVAGGAKRKKNLVCSFHPKISPLSEFSRSWKRGREYLHTVNRTWAKYVGTLYFRLTAQTPTGICLFEMERYLSSS